MFNSIIFDMDGVLIDSETFYFERRMKYFDDHHIEPASRNIMDYIGKTDQGTWEALVPDEKLRAEIKMDYDRQRDDSNIDFTLMLKEDTQEVLYQLKQVNRSIAIASSSPKSNIERMIQQCDLTAYVDYLISGEELKHSKPHPEIYQISAQKLGGTSLAVEDSPIGISSAKAAGLYTVALKQDYEVNQKQADVQIDSLLDLLKIIA